MPRKQSVLLVDDDASHRKFFSKRLEASGYLVLQTGTATEALQEINSTPIDLVLLDLDLPDMSGLEVLKRARLQNNIIQLPIIMLTGSADSRSIIDALNFGANDYVTKPTEYQVALARIKTHLTIKEQESELELQRARAVASAKMLALGELAAGAAHEINNPLAIICGTSSRLDQIARSLDPVAKDNVVGLAEKIQQTGMRIAKIVNAIEKFSRSADKDPLVEVSPEEFIDNAVTICNPLLKNGDIGLILPDKYPQEKVLCRSTEMTQVIYDLLSNACDAVLSLQERWVRIDVDSSAEGILISITDSGSEKRPEVVQKIFKPFFTTKPVGKGTGLGLSHALGVMQSYNGTLELDLECKNTRFVVKFPRVHRKPGLSRSRS